MKVTIAIVPPEEEQHAQLSVHNIDDNLKRIIANLQGIDSKNAKASNTENNTVNAENSNCLLYTSPSPRDRTRSRMPSSA